MVTIATCVAINCYSIGKIKLLCYFNRSKDPCSLFMQSLICHMIDAGMQYISIEIIRLLHLKF